MPRKKNNRKQEQKALIAAHPKPQWRGGVPIAPQANAQIGFALAMMAGSLAMQMRGLDSDYEAAIFDDMDSLYES